MVFWYINTMEYYSTIKKDEIMPFAANMDRLRDYHVSEVSQKKTNTI